MKLDNFEFIDALKNVKLREYIYISIIGVLIIIVLIASSINNNLSDNRVFRITIPPKLEFGKVISTDDINHEQVYRLAGEVMQGLYHWEESGKVNFKKKINKLSAYLTPEYKQFLLDQHDELNSSSTGELNKTRALIPLHNVNQYQKSFVTPIKNNTAFIVLIDFILQSHLENHLIQNTKIRYTVKVVIRDIDPNYNPWGWQLGIPPVKPLRLK